MRQVFGRKDAEELLIGCADPHIPVLRRALRFGVARIFRLWIPRNVSQVLLLRDIAHRSDQY
jgi:hypothetical protein